MTSQATTQGPTDAGLTARVLSSEWQPIETHKPCISSVFVCRADIETGHPTAVMIATHIDDDDWLVFGPMGPQNYKEPTHWCSIEVLPLVPTNPKGAA